MSSTLRFLIALLASFSLMLAACGGDDADDTTADAPAADSGSDPADSESDDDMTDDAEVEDDMAEASTTESARPSREELCAIIGGNVDQLAAYAQLNDVEETEGSVLFGDCAIESSSVGYVSLSLVPAFEPDLQTAAGAYDGNVVASGATDSIVLIEDPTGISHVALIEEGGIIYQLQISSDQATTQLAGVEEAAISLQASIRNR